MMTDFETWVVARVVAAHFWKLIVGKASETRAGFDGEPVLCSISRNVDVDSNQNKQVTWDKSDLHLGKLRCKISYLRREFRQVSTDFGDCRGDLKIASNVTIVVRCRL